MKKGFILSFEGGEACGKSTQIKLFKEYLDKKGIDYIALREPGGTEVGELLRKIYIDKTLNICPTAEALLMNAMRAQVVEEKVKPALKQGKLVLMDRYYHSSLVYQGYAVDGDIKMVKNIVKYATNGIKSDLTLYLDLDAQIAYQRKVQENMQDRFESRGLEFYQNVRKAYLKVAEEDKTRVKIIDASKSIEEVHKQMVDTFEQYYKN